MSKPPMNVNIPAPLVIRDPIDPSQRRNQNAIWTSISDLCRDAGVRLRVEDPEAYRPCILIDNDFPTARAWDAEERPILVIQRKDVPLDFPALRILEILAYGFFEYVARECLCHQGYLDTSSALFSQRA